MNKINVTFSPVLKLENLAVEQCESLTVLFQKIYEMISKDSHGLFDVVDQGVVPKRFVRVVVNNVAIYNYTSVELKSGDKVGFSIALAGG